MTDRILAVDPGDERIGIALSDPSWTIAKPLKIFKHVSRNTDAAKILDIASENEVVKIIIGQSLDLEGNPSPQGRKAQRLAECIQAHTKIKVEMWDESESTIKAVKTLFELNLSKKKRQRHRDDMAAMMILQDYLDFHKEK